MYFQYFLVLLPLIVRPVLTQGPPLLDALRSSGAAQYATLIESNPFALALHLSNQVKTVFAPADSTHGLKWKRDTTPADEQRFSLQSSADLNHLRDINTQPAGVTIHTRDGTANLGGTPQKVISVPRGTPQSDMTRRDSVLPKHQSNTTLPAICSGLGNRVNIIRGEIPYNGGLIHIIDE